MSISPSFDGLDHRDKHKSSTVQDCCHQSRYSQPSWYELKKEKARMRFCFYSRISLKNKYYWCNDLSVLCRDLSLKANIIGANIFFEIPLQ